MIRDSRCLPLLAVSCSDKLRRAAVRLDPAGPSAASIHKLGIVMYIGASAVTLLVIVLMLVPFMRKQRSPRKSKAIPVDRRAASGGHADGTRSLCTCGRP